MVNDYSREPSERLKSRLSSILMLARSHFRAGRITKSRLNKQELLVGNIYYDIESMVTARKLVKLTKFLRTFTLARYRQKYKAIKSKVKILESSI